MTSKKAESSRRRERMDNIDAPEQNDQTPVEIPAGSEVPARTIEQQIQEQIRIQLAKKRPGTQE